MNKSKHCYTLSNIIFLIIIFAAVVFCIIKISRVMQVNKLETDGDDALNQFKRDININEVGDIHSVQCYKSVAIQAVYKWYRFAANKDDINRIVLQLELSDSMTITIHEERLYMQHSYDKENEVFVPHCYGEDNPPWLYKTELVDCIGHYKKGETLSYYLLFNTSSQVGYILLYYK